MPNSVELVKLRKLRVRDGVLEPSIGFEYGGCGCKYGGCCAAVGSVGVLGSLGGGEESEKGRRGLGLRVMMSLSSSWRLGWLIVRGLRLHATREESFA